MRSTAEIAAPQPVGLRLPLPLEIRVHGRGGQGSVTCAKLLASIYAEKGLHVQSFGDYGSERAGAPVRAFTRVDTAPIRDHNKVYRPHHLLVLDAGLLADDVLDGAAPGALLLLNTSRGIDGFGDRFSGLRFAAVDATAIARRHGIGTSALVIINTTLAGAYARLLGLPWDLVERAFAAQGLAADLGAAQEAYGAAVAREPRPARALPARRAAPAGLRVPSIPEHTADLPPPMKTGSWRTQMPRYRPHAAPCSVACPAGNDVVGFVQALAESGVEAAARVLLRTQPLPSVCGRVCPAPCMGSCNRAAWEGAVNVRGLERWVGDRAGAAVEPVARAARPWRFAVVGGGPAGLGAAFALVREGHDVTLLDGGPKLGGVLRTGIPSYRLPPEALDRDIDRLLALGVKARCGTRLDAEGIRALAEGHDAVILAAGLPRLADLDAPGRDLAGIEQGLRFLDAAKRGASRPLRGHVVVVGGGNTAIDCARTALRCGAARVTIAYRRGREEMPAIAAEVDEALAEGVELRTRVQPVAFAGEGAVAGISLAAMEPGAPDARGRRRPVPTDRRELLACDAVLLALGQGSDLGVLPRGWTVRDGRALAEGAPLNLWLAGDMVTGDGTVTHAVGNGRRVAARALAALDGRAEDAPPDAGPGERVTPAHIRFAHFQAEAPRPERHAAPERRRTGFEEVNLGLEGPEEARRCFSCGRCTRCDTCLVYCPDGIIRRQGEGYAVDGAYCKGCGMCVAECPRRAMEMATEAEAR